MLFRLITALSTVALLLIGAESCTTDLHCSLNGVCDRNTSKCICDPGWVSDNCGSLDLRPVTRNAGYNHTVGVTNPGDYSNKGNSSWGGHIIQDRQNPKLFHLIIAQFDKGCGLATWRPFSYIIRAESTTGPQGPYKYVQRISDAFRHNPTTWWSPADSKYLMFAIGVDWKLPTKCSSTTPAGFKNNISISAADNIRGPWSKFQYKIDGTNPAPFPLWSKDQPSEEIILATEDMDLYSAPSWEGSFKKFYTPPWNQSRDAPTAIEDPFIWRDKRGHWHSLAHWMIDIPSGNKGPRVGVHMFSETLSGNWQFVQHEVYNTTIKFTDGTNKVLNRRERPKIFFSDDGNMTPLYLVNGVQDVGVSGTSYTLIQPIGDSAKAFENKLGF